MADCILPENPEPRFILNWILKNFSMDIVSLAWMFQTTKETIQSWMSGGGISHKNLMKLRKSYYFLNGTVDPHAGKRRCGNCGNWTTLKNIKNGLCKECEKQR